MIAAGYGHTNIVKMLIQWGAEVSATNNSYWTALHGAVYEGHVSTASALLDYGANIESRLSNGSVIYKNAKELTDSRYRCSKVHHQAFFPHTPRCHSCFIYEFGKIMPSFFSPLTVDCLKTMAF